MKEKSTLHALSIVLILSLILQSCSTLQEIDKIFDFYDIDDDCCNSNKHRKSSKKYNNPDKYLDEQEIAVDLLNDIRAENGLPALRFRANSRLQQAARIRAREIADYFSHTRPNGDDCSTVLDEVGLSFRSTGENIAYGTHVGPKQVITMWRNSSGHYTNMISPHYKEVGLASYHGKGNNIYWVQIFFSR